MKLFRIRRMLFCVAFSALPLFLAAQNRNISLSVQNQTVAEVLKLIEEKSGYNLFYNESSIDKNRKVNVNAKNKDVLDVLNSIFDGTYVRADIIDGSIVLSVIKKPEPTTSQSNASPNSSVQNISGTVIDSDGVAVIGAAIVSLRNKSNSCITDLDGKFAINADEGDVLEISAMGFTSTRVNVGGKMPKLVITLKEDIQMLDAVVFVGYGVQRRSDITGAISSVDAEKAKAIPTTSVAEMLRGSAPGIQVNVGSAAPGGSSTILIRGRHSLSGDNTPLYVVDGVPMSSIDDLNSSDIASMEVLKDASSQSIYGARAANGVILITTKRGAAGKTKVSYDGYVAVQTLNRNFEFYNGEEWAAYRHEAFYNGYGYYQKEDCFRGYMSEVLDSGAWVNWEELMIKPALQHNHNITVQAGNDKTKLAAGIGYYDQDGMVEGSDFRKFTGRLNIDQKLGKRVNLGANISYTRSWRHVADGSFNTFVTMPPLAKVYDENGNLIEDVTEAGESHVNPLWNINNSQNKTLQSRLLTNIFLDWNICKGLSYRLNVSMSQRDVSTGTYLGLKHTTGKNTQGKATVSNSNSADYLLENILNYTHDFKGGHHFDATLMQSVNYITWKKISNTSTGFANDDLGYNALSNALEYGQPDTEISNRQIVSFLARARYNYKDRYLFSAALRVDGSSVFGSNNKYGFFPSVAFAWRINKEDFMKSTSSWLNNLKLRLSWGQVGNQGISPYTTLGNTEKYYYRFGDTLGTGYLPSNVLYNPDLKWETSSTANIGIDFGFLKDRINGTLEFYDTRTTDLLVNRSINQVLGYSSQIVNLGQVENYGVEFTLNTTPVSTRNFSWDVDLSFAKNVNKIRRISGEVDADGKALNDVNNKWFIGYPVNVYYDYKFDGIWQLDDDIASSAMSTAKPGSIKIADTVPDGVINEDDRVIMSKDPDWIGNLSTSLHFFGFDLSASMNVSFGGIFYNSYLTSFANGGDLTGKRNGIRRDYWTKYNPSNVAPAPNMNQAPAYISSLGYQDATYVRLRSLTLGYTFKPEWINKAKMQSLRLYLTGNNVWYWTEVQGYGPEQSPGAYPEPRTFLFGVKVTF